MEDTKSDIGSHATVKALPKPGQKNPSYSYNSVFSSGRA